MALPAGRVAGRSQMKFRVTLLTCTSCVQHDGATSRDGQDLVWQSDALMTRDDARP